MNEPREGGLRGAASALLRSYIADLRGWVAKLATGYAVAAVVLVGGILALFAAIAVGITALFHLIERHYGIDVAYGGIGGGLLVLAIVLFLIGWALLRRRMAPLPRPHRQMQAAKRTLVRPAARRAGEANLMNADPVTGLLMGAAATLLAGWFVASRFQSSGRAERGRR
jgi:hypothetical protein